MTGHLITTHSKGWHCSCGAWVHISPKKARDELAERLASRHIRETLAGEQR